MEWALIVTPWALGIGQCNVKRVNFELFIYCIKKLNLQYFQKIITEPFSTHHILLERSAQSALCPLFPCLPQRILHIYFTSPQFPTQWIGHYIFHSERLLWEMRQMYNKTNQCKIRDQGQAGVLQSLKIEVWMRISRGSQLNFLGRGLARLSSPPPLPSWPPGACSPLAPLQSNPSFPSSRACHNCNALHKKQTSWRQTCTSPCALPSPTPGSRGSSTCNAISPI